MQLGGFLESPIPGQQFGGTRLWSMPSLSWSGRAHQLKPYHYQS